MRNYLLTVGLVSFIAFTAHSSALAYAGDNNVVLLEMKHGGYHKQSKFPVGTSLGTRCRKVFIFDRWGNKVQRIPRGC